MKQKIIVPIKHWTELENQKFFRILAVGPKFQERRFCEEGEEFIVIEMAQELRYGGDPILISRNFYVNFPLQSENWEGLMPKNGDLFLRQGGHLGHCYYIDPSNHEKVDGFLQSNFEK